MFKFLKNSYRLSSMGAKWVGATGVDPRDNGQVINKAMEYVNNLGMEPGDAWLTAMVNWIDGMPYHDTKMLLARAMHEFLDKNEGRIALSAVVILSARQAANQIIDA